MRLLLLLLASIALFSCQSTETPTVSVSGSAIVEVMPDVITFSISSSSTGDTTETARSASSDRMNSAVEILKSFGVSEEDIRTEYFSVGPVYSYADGNSVLEGQRAEQGISVVLHDIERAGEVIDELSALDGIEISGLVADKNDKSMALQKARELAVRDAYDKASVYAIAAGYGLGDLISLSDSVLPSPYAEAKVYSSSMDAATEYYSKEIEVRDSVNAVFSLVE